MTRQKVDCSEVSRTSPTVPPLLYLPYCTSPTVPPLLYLSSLHTQSRSYSKTFRLSEAHFALTRKAGVARPQSFHFRVRGPAQADRNRTAVILSLDRELLTALIKPKHFIVKVQHRNDCVNTVGMRYAVVHLRVHLRMRIVIYVAVGTFYSTVRAVLKVISENIPVVVRQAEPG